MVSTWISNGWVTVANDEEEKGAKEAGTLEGENKKMLVKYSYRCFACLI